MTPEELNGSIVTAGFPVTYGPDLTEVDRKFLMLYFSSDVFFKAMQDKSKGTTNRVRAKKVLPWRIQFRGEPPMKESGL